MTPITWDDEAKCELNCSALYLAKRGGRELGERFLKEVETAVAGAGNDPARHRKFRRDARKVRVEHFPLERIDSYQQLSPRKKSSLPCKTRPA